jgi:hypothetical protein
MFDQSLLGLILKNALFNETDGVLYLLYHAVLVKSVDINLILIIIRPSTARAIE